MNYVLNLSDDKRILSACVMLPNGSYDEMPIVDVLPDGNLYEYRYGNGEYVYDPLPEPEPVEPAPSDSERIDAIEQQIAALMGGVMDVQ